MNRLATLIRVLSKHRVISEVYLLSEPCKAELLFAHPCKSVASAKIKAAAFRKRVYALVPEKEKRQAGDD